MSKSSMLKLMAQEAHFASVIVVRLYFLPCLNSQTVFWKTCISVMEFSAKHSMWQLGYHDKIIHKIQFYYVTEACVDTMQSEQHAGEVCTV